MAGQPVSAQVAPSWTWAQPLTGPGLESGVLTASDRTGNVFQTGSFNNTLQLGATTLTTSPRSMYLVKYNGQGAVQWARQAQVVSTSGGAQAGGISITTDASGNAYVSGNFVGTIAFGSITLTAASGTSNVFVVKYNDQGAAQWALTSSNGSGNRTDASGITVGAGGDVYVSGHFTGITTFGGLSALSQGGTDIFLVKLNAAGVPQWVQSAGGPGADFASALAAGPNNGVYLSGLASAGATFGTLAATNRGGWDACLAQYDAQGTAQWVQSFGGSGDDGAAALVVVPTGELYNVGFFQNTATFGSVALTSQGQRDGYVLKCTAQGAPLWAKGLGGSGNDGAYGAAFSAAGALYVSGSFSATATVGTQSVTSAGGNDVFVARYAPSGAFAWAVRCGGPGSDADAGVAAGPNGALYLGGQFAGTAQFGGFSLTSQGTASGFVAALQDNTPTAAHAMAAAGAYELYPNPLIGTSLTLTFPTAREESAQVDVLDVAGRHLQHVCVLAEASRLKIIVPLQVLLPGRYLLKYSTVSGSILKPFVIL
ncbi:MAG: hypothetical protein JWR44_151 [Hymenobacter sp.]|jgi:hypothetical protein|nr:hypothetical protein [Hymenobacter sp.]